MEGHRWHVSPECDAALIRVLDELCTWERNTGGGSLVVVIPLAVDQCEVIVARDGKPLDRDCV